MKLRGFFRDYASLIGLTQKWLDIVLVFTSLLFFTYLVEGSNWSDSRHILLGIIACALFSFFAKQNDLYKSWRTLNLSSEFMLICYIMFCVIISILVIAFATQISSQYSRLVLGSWIVSTPVLLILLRTFVRKMLRNLRERGFNSRRVAVLGHGPLAQQLVREIASNEFMGIHTCGYYDDRKQIRENLEGMPDCPVLGGFEDAIAAAQANEFDELYIALPMKAEKKISILIRQLSDCSINVHLVPDIFTFNLINARTSAVGRLPIVSIYESPLDEYGALIKRLEDILLSFGILAMISIPMLLIALGIKITSRGPVLFKQRRYGLGGEEIWVWKFRSMTVAEDDDNIKQATRNDVRITRFGRFLRRTSLDELPQFINVLQGQMSIVGPRPHAVIHNELYRKVIDSYMLRHLVKPGITGWAQINGWRGETDSDEKMMKRIEYDLEYIKNWSLRLDLKIIFLTIFKGFFNKNAY